MSILVQNNCLNTMNNTENKNLSNEVYQESDEIAYYTKKLDTFKKLDVFEDMLEEHIHRIFNGLYAIIKSSSGNFEHTFQRIKVTLKECEKNIEQMDRDWAFPSRAALLWGLLPPEEYLEHQTKYLDLSWMKKDLSKIFAKHVAERMVGKRRLLLEMTEKAKGSSKKFFQRALYCHLKNVCTRDLANTALWQVLHNNKTVAYLYPSTHTLAKEYALPKLVEDALRASNCFAVEYHAQTKEEIEGAENEFASHLSLGSSWRESIRESFGDDLLEKIDFPCFEKYSQLLQHDTESFIFGRKETMGDKFVIASLTPLGDHALGSVLMKLTPFLQSKRIEASGLLNSSEDLISVIEDWQIGDIEKVTQHKLGIFEEIEPALNNMTKCSLIKSMKTRNQKMVNRIDLLIKDGLLPFAIIGASHFGGLDGILQLLKNLGYTLNKL